ncbi:hypothetical protein BJV78DRAFT_386540 [Lactifluus subvellereus]|nr:hypothetical protein BJV78DRAFT_386540 [Lactifluus subvellereus]
MCTPLKMGHPQPIPSHRTRGSFAADLESGELASRHSPAPHEIADPLILWAESAYPSPTTKQSNCDEINLADGLNSLFSVYTEKATEEDQKMAGGWMSIADGVLVMSCPFSIVVSIFLGRSYQDLLPNFQSASTFYLAQFYQLSVGQNNTLVTLPSTLSDPSTFSPSVPAVWVSALWSLSLVLSLTCGLFATLQKQWARRYLHITHTVHNPRARVRVREFMSQGAEKLRLPWVVEALPALFHTSVFLFFAGLAIYLSNINHTVFWVVIGSIAICAGIYLCISLLPIFRRDSPYFTPFSPLIRSCTMAVPWLTLVLLYHSTKRLKLINFRTRLHVLDLLRLFRRRMVGETMEVEDLVHSRSLGLDTPAMEWTFNTLNGDHDLERFLAGIPGFYGSAEVTKDDQILEELNSTNLPVAIVSFMECSLSSDLVAEPTKRTRVATCLKAIDANPLLLQCTFRQTLHFPQSSVFGCVDFVRLALAKSQSADADPWTRHFARCIIAVTVSRLEHHDDRWSDIVQRHLDSESSPLRWEEYRHQGNSVQLRNLVHFTRVLMTLFLGGSHQLEPGGIWHNTLQEVCKFAATHIAPELQHEFCTLWNELVNVEKDQQAPRITKLNAKVILSIIRTVYVPLHEGTESALVTLPPSTSDKDAPVDFQYDLCVVHSHHRRSSETDIPTPLDVQLCIGQETTAFRGREGETQTAESSKTSNAGPGEKPGGRAAKKRPEKRQASGSPTIAIPPRRGQLREAVGRGRTPSPVAVDSGIGIKDL